MKRIAYLDCLRGISMLMVVYCHVELFCFGLKEGELIGELFSICMLPLFFFVSGYFTPPPNLTSNAIIKRVRFVLVPTVMMFILYVGAYWGNYDKLLYCISGEYKFGYWFTVVLFEMNIIHYTLKGFSNNKAIFGGALLLVAAILWGLWQWDWSSNDAYLSRWFCLRLLSQHFPYYVLGMLFMSYRDSVHRLLSNEYVAGGILIAFAGLYLYPHGGAYKALLMGCLGMIIVYLVCYKYQNIFSDSTMAGKMLIVIGRNTLPIYLMHYFFFIGLKMLWVADYLSVVEQSWLIVIVATIITAIVVGASLIVQKVISLSTPLHHVMLGK